MRRLLRPIVIVVATLGLALGAGVGLAAPATADTGFTAAISNAPILNTSSEIDFAGTKPSTSTITSESSDIGGSFVSCGGTAPGSSNWVCEFDPTSDGFEVGNYSAQFVLTADDNTVSTQVLAFVIYASTDSPPPAPTTPLVGYQFTPGGVTVTTTATGDANAASTVMTGVQDGPFAVVACPAGTNSDHPLGVAPASPITCSNPASDPLPDETSVVAQSKQGTVGVGVSSDTSNGAFYLPSNDSAGIAFTVNQAALTVTVTGSVPYYYTDAVGVVIVDNNGGIVCRTSVFTVDSGNSAVYDWACPTSALSYGTHNLVAAVEDEGLGSEYASDALDTAGAPYGYYVEGALSSSLPVGTVTFTAPTTPTTGGDSSGDTTPDWSFTIGGDLTDIHPGDTLDISGSGLPAGTSLDTILHSVPTDLGSVVVAADGTFDQTVTVPADTELGDHTIMVTASGPGIVTTTKQQAITVTAVPAAASGTSGKSTGTSDSKPTATHGAGVGDPGTGIAPNILTRALNPIADVAVHPNKIISAFEIGLVLLLLAVLPAHLLNATIAEQSDRFERRFPKVHSPRWLTALVAWFRSAPVIGGIVVTLATAILFGFADPKFGFTLASLRLILACGIALFLVGYVANALTGLIARVQWNIVAAVSTRPYGLILTIVGVLISRLLHFSPGFLIGLILGLTIQGKSAAGFAWRTVVLRSSIVLIMAIAAWIGYSTLTLGGNEGGTFGSALLVETLVAITTEGVVALLVELLPLRFLEGERVYAHSRVLWGIFYVLTLVVFVLAVVPWEGNWDALGSSLWTWIIVLAAFALVCVGVYVYFRRFAPPLEEEAGGERVALGETVSGDRS
ncbi:MAG TPA: hypothetical protein VHZ98_17225 [Galbitalea sp.]|nr:hypothetical protein [Galbitalea sp.]